MALENITKNTKSIKTQVENVVNDNVEYYKLLGFKIAAKSATSLVGLFLMSLFVLLIVLMLAMAGGFALSAYWGNYAYGFLVMAGILVLLLILLILFRKFIIDRPVLRKFSKLLLNPSDK